MTHSLHRLGSAASLERDFVLLVTPARGVNHDGAARKLLTVVDILEEIGPANIGFYGLPFGARFDEIRKAIRDDSRLRCCIDDREKLKKALRRIRDENLGLSVTVSGLLAEIVAIANELELTPHTANISCGSFGKTERLPPLPILEITSMCGHGLIAPALVQEVLTQLRKGVMSVPQAVQVLAKPCLCGIFNPTRAAELLAEQCPCSSDPL